MNPELTSDQREVISAPLAQYMRRKRIRKLERSSAHLCVHVSVFVCISRGQVCERQCVGERLMAVSLHLAEEIN